MGRIASHLAPYAIITALSWAIYGHLFQSPLATSPAWDGQHFIAIAAHGYPDIIRNYSHLAYFPGLPLLIHFAHYFTSSWDLAAFVVSVIAGGVFICCSAEILYRRYGPHTAMRGAILLSLAPGAFLYGLAYSDVVALALTSAMFLALTSISYWRFHFAAAFGFLATLTSPFFVLPLCLVMLVESWRQTRRASTSLLSTFVTGLGAIEYLAYAGGITGRWDAWWIAEKAWGQGIHFSAPINWLHPSNPASYIPATECVTFAIVVLGYLAMSRARVPLVWYLYSAPMIFLGMFDGGNWLNPRILLDAFPLLLAIAVKVRGKWFVPVCLLSAFLMQAFLILYTWHWANLIAQP